MHYCADIIREELLQLRACYRTTGIGKRRVLTSFFNVLKQIVDCSSDNLQHVEYYRY